MSMVSGSEDASSWLLLLLLAASSSEITSERPDVWDAFPSPSSVLGIASKVSIWNSVPRRGLVVVLCSVDASEGNGGGKGGRAGSPVDGESLA